MNYNVENESVGSNGLGGLGFGGGSWGFLILIFLFFAIFSSGNGLFGHRDGERREEPHNWFLDRDILETRYSVANQGNTNTAEIIANQNAIDQRRADRELVDAKNTIAQMQTVSAITERCQHTDDELCWIKNHMSEKPPVYSQAYLPAGASYPLRGFENSYY